MDENIVKRVCKELGITQKQLAERMKVSETTITSWSKGHTQIPEWALSVFELLKCEKKYLAIKEAFTEIEKKYN